MNEKLFPLSFPPGLQNSGTQYQAKGRWHAGNCIRFYGGNVEPVGGWVQRTLSGAAITGVPNAAISWQVNDGTSYLVIGTTTGLFVVTAANVVYNITPAYAGLATSYQWQLEVFGSYCIAVINEVNNATAAANWFYWDGNLANIAAMFSVAAFRNGPQFVNGVVVTPERFLVLLRGGDPQPFGGTAYPVVDSKVN